MVFDERLSNVGWIKPTSVPQKLINSFIQCTHKNLGYLRRSKQNWKLLNRVRQRQSAVSSFESFTACDERQERKNKMAINGYNP